MPDTKNLGMSYPEENEDPHFEKLASFFEQIDQKIYALTAINQPILGGGNYGITWIQQNPWQAKFTWDEDFEIQIPGSGYFLKIPFGPDHASREISLVDGDRVIVNVPFTSTEQVTGYFEVINGKLTRDVVNLEGLYTIGIFRNGKFYHNLPRVSP